MKVLFHYDAGQKLAGEVAQLKDRGLNVFCCPEGQDEPFHTELKDTEVLWHVLHPVTADVISRAPKLKLIQKFGVGVNTIDLEAARARDIPVCNMPGANSRAVAEMTLLLILSALRKQPRIDRICRSGQWKVDKTTQESFDEIYGSTIGLVGFGDVPILLAPILEAMGANVIYHSRTQKPGHFQFCSLDELLTRSDIVSLHIPLTSETRHIMDKTKLASMKPGSILVNAARGPLVDEQALYQALTSGHLSAAGLDVFENEPVTTGNPLLALDNVAVTPHVAWLTNETLARKVRVAINNSLAIRDGLPLQHLVP